MLLSAENISKNYGLKQLLSSISLYLTEKERIGIVGINGTGKSTLLKILAKIEPPDEGNVTKKPNLSIVYLPQNPIMNDSFTVLEQVFFDISELQELKIYEAKSMLNKLGITDFNATIGTLSGGQRKRVALAVALTHPADVLILDEPTNHLDVDMVDWLEQYLARFSGGIIMVTHDRYFLERVATRIIELDRGNLYSYDANYSKYLELKSERLQMDEASARKRQSYLRRESQWILQGAKARGTKSKDRIDRYYNMKEQVAEANPQTVQMATLSTRLGRKIIEVQGISKTFDNHTVISNFSYMISRDDRIGIVGRNGVGKSTLLNIIAEKLIPDTGIIDIGSTVKIGYFTQECKELDMKQRVYDFITDIASEIKTSEGTFSAAQMLERFLFTSDLQFTTIGRLSGGERRRLYLLSILMEAPNVLLLDEPTNDLDIETLTILEDYLQCFSGAVIAVSHDRYFLDKMANCIFEVAENGKILSYNGNYSDYASNHIIPEIDNTDTKLLAKKPILPTKTRKAKFTFKEQQEFATIDDDIATLEEAIANCSIEITNYASNYLKLQECMDKKVTLEAQLDAKTERWLYLNELAEEIGTVGSGN